MTTAPGRAFCRARGRDWPGDYELRVVEAFENDPIAGYTLEFDLSQMCLLAGALTGHSLKGTMPIV